MSTSYVPEALEISSTISPSLAMSSHQHYSLLLTNGLRSSLLLSNLSLIEAFHSDATSQVGRNQERGS